MGTLRCCRQNQSHSTSRHRSREESYRSNQRRKTLAHSRPSRQYHLQSVPDLVHRDQLRSRGNRRRASTCGSTLPREDSSDDPFLLSLSSNTLISCFRRPRPVRHNSLPFPIYLIVCSNQCSPPGNCQTQTSLISPCLGRRTLLPVTYLSHRLTSCQCN